MEEEAADVYGIGKEEGTAEDEFEEEDQHIDANEAVGNEGDGLALKTDVANGNQRLIAASLLLCAIQVLGRDAAASPS